MTYYPGPGSYNTKVSGIKQNYVTKDSFFSGVVPQSEEQGVYYTRENGSLIKHTQPLALDKTMKEGIMYNKEQVENVGPGYYQPKL